MQMNVAGLRRNIKNLAHNYSDAQVKVREATSNDPWGPSATIMAEIADLTYNVVAFSEIMQMVWKRLNDHGKNWRHVYKALIVLEYLIKTGSEKVAQQCVENIFAIQTLREFVYYEEGKDQGLHVREKAKQLVILLKDDERLKNERAKALKAKERFAQHPSGFGSDGYVDGPTQPTPPGWRDEPPKNPGDMEFVRPQTAGEEELQLQLAMAMSREEAEQEEAKRRSDDVRLQLALSQSEQDFKRPGDRKPEDKQSHLLDLLDISLGAASLNSPTEGAAGTTDPWGTPNHLTQHAPQRPDPWSGATSPHSADPWQAPPRPPISIGASADSWLGGGQQQQRTRSPALTANPNLNDMAWRQQNSTPTSALNGNLSHPGVATDPWLAKSTAISVASQPPPMHDPWLGIRGTPKNDDPWLAKSTTNADPWTTGSNNLESRPSPVGAITSPLSELDDFDIITNRNKSGQYNTNGANNNNSSLLDDMDPLSLKKSIKSPQSFLGENSSLVNLDNLIKPAMPMSNSTVTGAAYNPFSDSNLAPAAKPNLFQQQQQAVPSINQLKQQPFHVTLNQDPWAPVNSNNTTTQLEHNRFDDDDDDDDDDDCFFDTNHIVLNKSDSIIFGNATNGLSNSNLDLTSFPIIDNNNLYSSTTSINSIDNIRFNNTSNRTSPLNQNVIETADLITPTLSNDNPMMKIINAAGIINNNNNNHNNSNLVTGPNVANTGLLSFANINYLDNNNTPWMKPDVASATNPFLS